MSDDATLLRTYLEQKSEAAFTELVQRHLPLVYGLALRRLGGDAHLAQDVAQTVFTDLARKAHDLISRESLTSWLYVSTHHASAAMVRSEQRRKIREQHLMPNDAAQLPNNPPSPELDEAIIKLAESDQAAISLRFFERRSLAEVGIALRISEEAARKRVDRALEKLRTLLARRGITSTATALGLALTTAGVNVAPTPLSSQIAETALARSGAGAAASGPAVIVGKSLLPLAATIGLGTLLLLRQYTEADALKAELARQQTLAHSLAAVRNDNTRLAQAVADAAHKRGLQSTLSHLRAINDAPQASARGNVLVEVTAKGAILWDNKSVTITEFLARLQQVRDHQQSTDSSRLICRVAENATTDAVHYITEELRRASLSGYEIVLERAKSGAPTGNPWF